MVDAESENNGLIVILIELIALTIYLPITVVSRICTIYIPKIYLSLEQKKELINIIYNKAICVEDVLELN